MFRLKLLQSKGLKVGVIMRIKVYKYKIVKSIDFNYTSMYEYDIVIKTRRRISKELASYFADFIAHHLN